MWQHERFSDAIGSRGRYKRSQSCRKLCIFIHKYESPELHNLEQRKEELKKLGLPKQITKDLGETRRRVELPDYEYVKYIEFCSILDVTELEVNGVRLINLVYELDNYSDICMFVWNPSQKAIGSYDLEHENLTVIHDATWKKVWKDPGYYIDRILEGEYDTEEV
ncbi:hypothetical protein [Brevibacillus laterosporus]|uniref:hypothetical protein n=1 Tax=Brevibacillus laterosporus TaxID=1465 RepID=UPI00264D79E7|nr:hypothetical protein [Brevibacillus laterosporus]MDN9009916.1 hypothetical protein [Brevibacillus laterosporus]MDO0940702.1 hypothetical protein [Brevibacillus laterosporus]